MPGSIISRRLSPPRSPLKRGKVRVAGFSTQIITDLHRFFRFRKQYGQFIDVDKSKLIVNMKNIVLVVRVVFPKKVSRIRVVEVV